MRLIQTIMSSLRTIFMMAVKSLVRGRSFLKALLAFWISPTILKSQDGIAAVAAIQRTIQDFLKESEEILLQPLEGGSLKAFSRKLKSQFRERLLHNPECMLPSYNHQLPNGAEQGQYLSLDVGGSTLRVALVELRGRQARGKESTIVRIDSFKITPELKQLEGRSFFDWMASRIIEVVAKDVDQSSGRTLPAGLAWSFPIEQTSMKGGLLQGMGKGFRAADGLLGENLGEIIETACAKQGLQVELGSIVNDSAAALLSEAYIKEGTRFGLILGTGLNIAVHLPVPTVGRSKFGTRPDAWFEAASHVIINTELGMFGHGILPRTRWDEALNDAHPKPDFQPLEHLVSGYYLGEMARLMLVEAIGSTGIFGGVVPPSLLLPYSLDTETISIIEADTSATLEKAIALFKSRHPSPSDPTRSDIAALRSFASLVSRRSAALVAAAVFALWELKAEAEEEYLRSLTATGTEKNDAHVAETRGELGMQRTMVGFNGSVMECYPAYRTNCQNYIDGLVASEDATAKGSIELVPAKESSLLGAAVALACAQEGKA